MNIRKIMEKILIIIPDIIPMWTIFLGEKSVIRKIRRNIIAKKKEVSLTISKIFFIKNFNFFRKNSFYNNSANYNTNTNSHGFKNKKNEKRERFNSEVVTDFNLNNKFFNQKSFHKNSFSNEYNIYFGKNPSETLSGLTSLNTPINSVSKNFSHEIEIDTSKIKYHLQSKIKI